MKYYNEFLVNCYGFEPIKLLVPIEKNKNIETLIEQFAEDKFNGQSYEIVNLKSNDFEVAGMISQNGLKYYEKYVICCEGFEPLKVLIPLQYEPEEVIQNIINNNYNGQTCDIINLQTIEEIVL